MQTHAEEGPGAHCTNLEKQYGNLNYEHLFLCYVQKLSLNEDNCGNLLPSSGTFDVCKSLLWDSAPKNRRFCYHTHTHVIPNLNDFLSSVEPKTRHVGTHCNGHQWEPKLFGC